MTHLTPLSCMYSSNAKSLSRENGECCLMKPWFSVLSESFSSTEAVSSVVRRWRSAASMRTTGFHGERANGLADLPNHISQSGCERSLCCLAREALPRHRAEAHCPFKSFHQLLSSLSTTELTHRDNPLLST